VPLPSASVFASFAPASASLRFCFASASAPSPLPETSWDILFQFDVLSVSLPDQVYRLPAHFFSLFFEVFFGGVSSGFLQSLWLQGGSIGGSLLEIFLKSFRCSRKRWYPRF